VIYGLDSVNVDIVAAEDVFEGAERLCSEGFCPAEDLDVHGPSESVRVGEILGSAGENNGEVVVVRGHHTGHIRL